MIRSRMYGRITNQEMGAEMIPSITIIPICKSREPAANAMQNQITTNTSDVPRSGSSSTNTTGIPVSAIEPINVHVELRTSCRAVK